MLAAQTAEISTGSRGCWKTITLAMSGYDTHTGIKNQTYLQYQPEHNQRAILEMQDEQIQRYKVALESGFDIRKQLNDTKQLEKQLVETLYQKRHYLMQMMKNNTELLLKKKSQKSKLPTDQTELTAPQTLSCLRNTTQSSKSNVISIFRKNTLEDRRPVSNRAQETPNASRVVEAWVEHPTADKRNRIEFSTFQSNKQRVHRLSIDEGAQHGDISKRTAGTFSRQVRPAKTDLHYLTPPAVINQPNIQCNQSQIVDDEDYYRAYTENSDYETYLKLRENELARQRLNTARLNMRIHEVWPQPTNLIGQQLHYQHPVHQKEEEHLRYVEMNRDPRQQYLKTSQQKHIRNNMKIHKDQLPRRSQKIGEKKPNSHERTFTKSSWQRSQNERKDHRRIKHPERQQYITEIDEPREQRQIQRHILNQHDYIKTESDEYLSETLSQFLHLLSQCILLNDQTQKFRIVLKHVHTEVLSLLGLASGSTNHRKLISKLVSIIHTKRSYDMQQIEEQVAWMFPHGGKITQQQMIQHLRARPHSRTNSPPRCRRDLDIVSDNLKKFFCSLAELKYFEECLMDMTRSHKSEVQSYIHQLGHGHSFSQFDLYNNLKQSIDCNVPLESVELFLEQRFNSGDPYKARDFINWLLKH